MVRRRVAATFLCLCLAVLAETSTVQDQEDSGKLGHECTQKEQQGDCGMLVCRNSRCSFCEMDVECQRTYDKFECRNQQCVHKRLFPMNSSDIMATVFAFFIIALASGGGGIGGGGALVPIYVLISGFKPSAAIPLSKATILGGAISNLILNWPKRHPTADRPLIDFHLAALFVPTQLVGTMVGVLCNKTWPDWLIYILLVVFLTWLTRITIQKGLIIHRAEVGVVHEEDTEVLLSGQPKDTTSDYLVEQADVAAQRRRHIDNVGGAEMKALIDLESRPPWRKLILLGCLWLFIVVIALVKGGEGGSIADVTCGSALYWLLFLIPFPVIITVVLYLGKMLREMHDKKEELGYIPEPGDVVWNKENSMVYPAINIMVGFGAGSLGIGGGTMTGPLMLHLKMIPPVVSATAAFMILFTSSITTSQFIIFGTLEPSYGSWFCMFGFLSSFVGQTLMAMVLKKYKKQSVVVFCISGILGLSAVLLGIQGVVTVIRDLELNVPMGFRPLCGASV